MASRSDGGFVTRRQFSRQRVAPSDGRYVWSCGDVSSGWLVACCLALTAVRCPAVDSLPPYPRGLFVVDADGGNMRKLLMSPEAGFDNCGSLAWSPDGSQIVFDACPGGQRALGRIYVLHLLGTLAGQLEDLGPGISPIWSPDGTEIAFFLPSSDVIRGCTNGVYLMDSDGVGRRKVCKHKLAAWAPNGEFLVCNPNWSSGPKLSIVDLQTLQQWPLEVKNCYFHGRPAFATNSRTMFISAHRLQAGSVVMQLDISQQPPTLMREWQAERLRVREASISRDGSRIAGTRLLAAGESRLLVFDTQDDKPQVNLLPPPCTPSRFCEPSWSPDVKQLVFAGCGLESCPPCFDGLQPQELTIWRRFAE